jgi:glycosyltransferase involved in cell wall biosynthesis
LKSNKKLIADAINIRFRFILEQHSISDLTEETLDKKLETFLVSRSLTSIDFYLIITGQYPSYSELKELNFNLQTLPLSEVINQLVDLILSSEFRKKVCLKTILVRAVHSDLIDITHTHNYPHVTGIQRVVRKTVDCTTDVSLVVFDHLSRSFTEISRALFVAHATKAVPDVQIAQLKIVFEQKIINFLYHCLPKLEKSNFGLFIKKLSLPTARAIKLALSTRIKLINQNSNTKDGKALTNIYISGSRLTIIDIPQIETIDIYQALFESKFLKTQVVVFDFIPIFHTWAVDRLGVATHFNKYLRIILFADRLVCISSLVAEQAKLLVSAFKLERANWNSVYQKIEFHHLPSGLEFENQFKSLKRVPGRILIVGSIEPRKNHMQIFHALKILHGNGFDFEVNLVGNAGWENESILKKLQELRKAGIRIERKDYTDDVELKTLLATSSLGIFISEAEGFGLPLVESRKFGLRILYSKIRPHIDLSYSFLEDAIEIGDATGLAKKIEERLSTNPTAALSLSDGLSDWSEWTNFLFLSSSYLAGD